MTFGEHGRAADEPSGDDVREAAHAEVASTLWREREQLEELLYALTCQQLVLAAGGVRWLTRADGQVQDAVAAVADSELRRAIATDILATQLGLAGDTTLDAIIAAADEPWDTLLADHRDALRRLISEISLATAENRRLLQAGAELARDTLAQVSDSVGELSGTQFDRPGGGASGPVPLHRQV